MTNKGVVFMKKLCSTVLAAAVVLQGLCTVSFTGSIVQAAETPEVLYQQTFSNWNVDGWTGQQAPPGMVLANADLTGKSNEFMTNLKPYSDDDGNKSALMWRRPNSGYPHQWYYEDRNGAFDVIPFNKVINNGKIYVSMDVFIPEYAWYNDENRYYNDGDLDGTDADNAKKANGANAISIFNTSTVDYDVDYSGTKWTYKATGEDLTGFIAADSESNHSDPANYVSNHQSMLAQFSFPPSKSTASVMTGAFTRIDSNANADGSASNKWTNTSKGWHKFQFIVDCDTTVKNSDDMWEGNLVKVYIDGTAYNENASTAKLVSDNVSGYKGIGLYRRGWARPGVRYDNIYVSHYTDTEDSVKLLESEKDFSDKKVSVAFTEYLNKTPEVSDFDVKTNVGTPIEGYTVSGDARKVTFDFTNATKLPIDGKVIISAKNTLTGKISGINVSGSMEIPFGFSGTNVFEKQDDDGDWFAATTLSDGDKIRAHINVANGYSEKKNMVYIITKYTKDEDGSLILSEIVKCEPVECDANGTKELITEITPVSGAIYKAFAWNSNGYRPFMEAAVIQ